VETAEVERVHEDVLPIAGLVEVINIRRRSDRRPAFSVDFAFLGPVPALFFNVSLFLVVLGFGSARWSAPSALFLILGGQQSSGAEGLEEASEGNLFFGLVFTVRSTDGLAPFLRCLEFLQRSNWRECVRLLAVKTLM
jgi:hypothetical protein